MHPRPILRLPLVALASLLVACSGAASSDVAVSDAWVRPGVSGAESAAYFTITNSGAAEDAVLSVSTPDSAMAELHQTTTDAAGMTGMSPLDQLTIPAGKSVSLAPGATHVMLMGLTRELTAGNTVELHLVFREAGAMTVQATVRQP